MRPIGGTEIADILFDLAHNGANKSLQGGIVERRDNGSRGGGGRRGESCAWRRSRRGRHSKFNQISLLGVLVREREEKVEE